MAVNVPAQILDGKAVAKKVKAQVANDACKLKLKGITPGLAVIIVGSDPASRVYVDNKKKDCVDVGIRSQEYSLPADVTQERLMGLIAELNASSDTDGILVQLPLPDHIDEKAVISAIDPSKDVDAFHPVNVGHIMIGDFDFLPCTPAGVMELLDDAGISVEGKECVVIGRSNIVGKPMAMLLLHRSGTVTICHSRTKNLAAAARRADILVAAIGKPRFVGADMVKDGAVVIDVGMNRMPNGRFCGDVDFDAVFQKASFITPVPGGVGPMTRAMLLKNTIKAAHLHNSIDKQPPV
jgi:methylenetetrahydrofolate dehydrogenase (NADP+)/methenyltetrahydrofolate cyclohydrolase